MMGGFLFLITNNQLRITIPITIGSELEMMNVAH